MSNKKRISKKREQLEVYSVKKKYIFELLKLRLENAMLRAQLYMVSSQPKKEYPSGGNIGLIKSDGSKEKISDRRGNIKHVGIIGTPENNSYFQLKDGSKLKVSEIEKNYSEEWSRVFSGYANK